MYNLEAHNSGGSSLINFVIDFTTFKNITTNTASKFQNGSFIVKLEPSRYICIKYSGYGSYSLVAY